MNDYLTLNTEIFKIIQEPLGFSKQRIAQYISIYPDLSDLLLQIGKVRDGSDAIIAIWTLEYVLPGARTRHQVYDQREYIARMAHREGKYWKIVRELLLQPQGIYFLEKVIFENLSPEDIFGNLVPRLKKKISKVKPSSKWALEQRHYNLPVLEANRKRGYTDKGTMLPSHKNRRQNLGELGESEKRIEVPFNSPRRFQWVDERRNSRYPLREKDHIFNKVKKLPTKEVSDVSLMQKVENLKKQNLLIQDRMNGLEVQLIVNNSHIAEYEERILKFANAESEILHKKNQELQIRQENLEKVQKTSIFLNK